MVVLIRSLAVFKTAMNEGTLKHIYMNTSHYLVLILIDVPSAGEDTFRLVSHIGRKTVASLATGTKVLPCSVLGAWASQSSRAGRVQLTPMLYYRTESETPNDR